MSHLGQFWLRRARRLLPALLVMLAGGRHRRRCSSARRRAARRAAPRPPVGDLLPRQLGPDPRRRPVLRRRPAAAAPPVEPGDRGAVLPRLAARLRRRWRALGCGTSASPSCSPGRRVVAMVWTWRAARRRSRADSACFGGVDRVNFMYLSTFTRSIGTAARRRRGVRLAAVAAPDRGRRRGDPRPGSLDGAGAVALSGARRSSPPSAALTAGYVYQWLLPLVSVLALVAVLVVGAPGGGRHPVRALVAPARRDRQAQLRAVPVALADLRAARMRPTGRSAGSSWRAALSVVATELSYRYVETPVRQGAPAALVAAGRAGPLAVLLDRGRAVVILLVGCYAAVRPVRPRRRRRRRDVRRAGRDADDRRSGRRAGRDVTPDDGRARPPRRRAPAVTGVAIVGDSQAHALAVNLPTGIESTFDDHRRLASTAAASTTRGGCAARATSFQQLLRDVRGLAAAVGGGGHERRCRGRPRRARRVGRLRPRDRRRQGADVRHAGVGRLRAPAPAERHRRARRRRGPRRPARGAVHAPDLGRGRRPCRRCPSAATTPHVAHVNELWRAVAAANPATTTFVDRPGRGAPTRRWPPTSACAGTACTSTSRAPKLIFDTIAPALLAI